MGICFTAMVNRLFGILRAPRHVGSSGRRLISTAVEPEIDLNRGALPSEPLQGNRDMALFALSPVSASRGFGRKCRSSYPSERFHPDIFHGRELHDIADRKAKRGGLDLKHVTWFGPDASAE